MAKQVKPRDRHFDHATWDCVLQKGNVPKLTLDFSRDPMPTSEEPAKNHFLGTIQFLDNRHMVNDERGNRFAHSSTGQNAELKIVVEGKYNVIRLAKWLAKHNSTGANTAHLKKIPEWLHEFGGTAPRAAYLSAPVTEQAPLAVEPKPAALPPVAEKPALQEPLPFPTGAQHLSAAAENPATFHDGYENPNASHVEKLALARALKAAARAKQAQPQEPEQLSLQGDPAFLRPSSFIKARKQRKERDPKSPLHPNTDTLSGDLWADKTSSSASEQDKGRSK